MNSIEHMDDEALLSHYYGDAPRHAALHVAECHECRLRWEALKTMLDSVEVTVPEPDEFFEKRVWAGLQPRLEERKRWWTGFLPGVWAYGAVAAAVLVAVFMAGRASKEPAIAPDVARQTQVRERILLVALGDHLDRSQMVLMELSNAPGNRNIAREQALAEDLIDSNRLLRQTAMQSGQAGWADTLQDLERVFQEISHSPQGASTETLQALQRRMEERGILFKVRVLNSQVRSPRALETF